MSLRIALIKIGQIEYLADYNKIAKWKSELFIINKIQCVTNAPESDVHDGYLDNKYTRDGLKKIVSCPKDSDIAIAIIPYRFDDNFYLHRLSKNCAALSLHRINDILKYDGISMENFILKQIYEICALNYLVDDFGTNEVYTYVHLDTKGCLFDMNGNREDILRNTEKPIICDTCKSKFGERQIDSKFLATLEKEIKRLKKPLILRIENRIKKYPFLSMLVTALIAIFLNLISNMIYELISKK
jgi:hypothetical protein